jgi:hypothetical protein
MEIDGIRLSVDVMHENTTHMEGSHVPTRVLGRTKEASDIISHDDTHEMAAANCMLHIHQDKPIE